MEELPNELLAEIYDCLDLKSRMSFHSMCQVSRDLAASRI